MPAPKIGSPEAVPAGWSDLISWFGAVPTFHDAEVERIDLRRSPEPSEISIRTRRMTSDVDERGYFVLDRHVNVVFRLIDVVLCELSDWNHQNVLFGLTLGRDGEVTVLELESCYGVGGKIASRTLSVQFTPVVPAP